MLGGSTPDPQSIPTNIRLSCWFMFSSLIQRWFDGLLRFCILRINNVISVWVPTCDNACSGWLYSVATSGYHAANTLTEFPTNVTVSLYWANQCLLYLSGMDLTKVRNIVARAGIIPTFLASQAIMLMVTPLRLPDVTTIPTTPVMSSSRLYSSNY